MIVFVLLMFVLCLFVNVCVVNVCVCLYCVCLFVVCLCLFVLCLCCLLFGMQPLSDAKMNSTSFIIYVLICISKLLSNYEKLFNVKLTVDSREIHVWIGLEWIGLEWIGLDWIGLDWIGLKR